jgi:peptidoglycan/xylan/chitin deacetylase (PgdA/CDA1 family)
MKKKTIIAILSAFLLGMIIFSAWFNANGSGVDSTDRPVPAVLPAPSSTAAALSVKILNVPILIYHSVAPYSARTTTLVKEYTIPPETFDAQLNYLKINGYTVISYETLIDAMTAASSTLPARSVVITFDDGWEDQYRDAFPILKKYADTATFFVFTNGMGNSDFMSWDQLKEMQAAGMDIESHSISHPFLFTITNKDDVWKEIEGSREIIAAHLGKAPDIFAYPFGKYNDLDVAMLKAAGYRAARADLGWPLASSAAITATTTDVMYKLNGAQVTNSFQRFLLVISRAQ